MKSNPNRYSGTSTQSTLIQRIGASPQSHQKRESVQLSQNSRTLKFEDQISSNVRSERQLSSRCKYVLNSSESNSPELKRRTNNVSIFTATEVPQPFRIKLKPFRRSFETHESTEILKNLKQSDTQRVEDLIEEHREQIQESQNILRPVIQAPRKQDYLQYYRKAERLSEYQQLLKIDPNIYTRMNAKVQDKLLPKSLQLFGQTERICANSLFGSDQYLEVFVEGLINNDLKSISLRENQIESKRMRILLQKMPVGITELDLQGNNIGLEGIKYLGQFLVSKNCFLQILNLEENKLKDPAVIALVKVLSESKTIRILNLSNNSITCQSMEPMGIMLKKSTSLLELYLHYNQIRNQGGNTFFRALAKNQYLKVLDLSFNKISDTDGLIEVLSKPHPELCHIDLSYNSFHNSDTLKIHKALIFNQNIYGFHLDGNGITAAVNPRGYLLNQDALINKKLQRQSMTDMDFESDLFSYGIKQSMQKLDENFQICDPKFFRRIQSTNCVNSRSKDNCWICQGFVEIQFKWTPGRSGRMGELIFLHLDFEDYRPMIMERSDDFFELWRMCPPGHEVKYFFSNPLEDIQFIAKDQKTTSVNDLKQGVIFQYADGTCMQSQKISIVNYLKTGQNLRVIDATKHYVPTVSCKPRQQEKIFDIDPKMAKQRQWSVENSIFRDFQADNEGHIMDCYEFDFECGRLQKHISNQDDYERLKSMMKLHYKNILSCYKYYCAQSLNYDMPLVNQQSFMDFISSTSILDKQVMNGIDLQLTFMSSYVTQRSAEWINIQDRCLVRFQFMEVIIRLAKEQYRGIDISEAVNKLMLQDQVLDQIKLYGVAQDWRDARYWTQLMDITIRHKYKILQIFYEHTTKLSFKHERYITLMDWKQFVYSVELEKYITEKELYLIYLQSMQTQRDEVNDSRYMQMGFLEYIEALARLAEWISPVSPMYHLKNPLQLSTANRKALPLFVKFEGLIYIIFHRLKIQSPELEKDVLNVTVLRTAPAKKMGIYEDQNSDEEGEQQKYTIHQLLPSDEVASPPKKKSTGWNKVRTLTKKQSQIESMDLLKKINTYQQIEDVEEQIEYEQGTIHDKFEMQKKRAKRQEYMKTAIYHEPTFKFEEQS